MAKSKAKSPPEKIPEGKLLKALAELEDAIEKGDVLEDADPEGGLSTEGEPLSNAAPSGKSDTKKSRRSSSSSSSSAASSDDGDDDSSSDDASSPFPPKKKMKKGAVERAAAASKDSMSDEESSDEESSDDASSPAEKSFREVAEGDEVMAKAIDVSDFMEALVDQISLAMLKMGKDVAKSMVRIEERLGARIDNRVAKSIGYQQSFNARLAKAVAAIGTSVQEDLVDMVKSLSEQPAPQRGRAVLSKGEVNQPPWQVTGNDQQMAGGSEGGAFIAELSELSSEAIGDWLFKATTNNKIDPKLILAWEADRYNVETLPPMVRKALVNDLCK
jgi:hypothetical protein